MELIEGQKRLLSFSVMNCSGKMFQHAAQQLENEFSVPFAAIKFNGRFMIKSRRESKQNRRRLSSSLFPLSLEEFSVVLDLSTCSDDFFHRLCIPIPHHDFDKFHRG